MSGLLRHPLDFFPHTAWIGNVLGVGALGTGGLRRAIRHDRAVTLPPARPATPFGLRFSDGHPPVHTLQLEPGDRLALYTDGVVEARRLGQFFTEERLADFVVRESASGLDGAEVLRRLIRAVLDHQHGVLQDDATILLLEWDGPPA